METSASFEPDGPQDSATAAIKAYDEIPVKKSYLPALLGLIMSGGPGYLHEHCDARHRELGPIFRERLGSHELVFIANTRMIQTVIANEGPLPHHNIPEAWLLYNQVRRLERGLFFQMGEPWLKLRRAMNKVLLADTAQIRRFTSAIIAVNSDLMNAWCHRLDRDHEGAFVVRDIKFELCKWSIEATGVMLFGQRMGCLARGSIDSRAERLVANVASMFEETSRFQVIPPRLAHKLNLGAWRRFVKSSDKMVELANGFAKEFTARAKQLGSSESLVRDLLDLECLDDDEISRSMVDLIIAAADTTSNSLQWMLYMLAKHPEAQFKILEESHDLLETRDHTQVVSTPYLSGFVKEVSRLYPTAPFLARTLDRRIVLDNYEIPAGRPIVLSLYTTSRLERYFPDALAFKPERWLRARPGSSAEEAGPRQHASYAYATLPFGIGARMCIGRRMADLEMHLLIASIVSRFEVTLARPSEETRIKLKMILCPDKPICLRLKPRV